MAKASRASVKEFITNSGADTILTDLKTHFSTNELKGQKFVVSDVYDQQGNQYVDLVQEGGGVWGVALLGYTYILEKMGIRFFSLAGTSAGAINTMLLAGTKNKEEEKVETIIDKFLDLDLFSFVDGKKGNLPLTKWVKKIIQKFVLRKNYLKSLKKLLMILAGLLVISTLAAFITGIFFKTSIVKWVAITSLFIWVVITVLIIFLATRIKRLAKTGYGLNTGDAFHKWISDRLLENKINTLEDLRTHFSKVPPNLNVRPDPKRDDIKLGPVLAPSNPMLTIITSDITTGSKIEFPRMWDLYWCNRQDVNPADFVRASMSIPVFFETYTVPVSDKINKPADKWKDHINWEGRIPKQVRFVDGGALSNFPINVFFNPDYIIPRMPTFGIRLGNHRMRAANNLDNLASYFRAIISTLTGNTDKDFINKNKAFTLGVMEVDMKNHSWLNFFMDEKEKQEIFLQGAKAAATFLKSFDWEEYKKQRFDNNEVLKVQRKNPNNWQ